MEKIKKIDNVIVVAEYLITFSYETKGRGYYREQQRLIDSYSKEDAIRSFNAWSENVRTMSNVQILDVEKTDTEAKFIEI